MKTYLINKLKKVSSTVVHHMDFLSTIKSQEWTIFSEDNKSVEKFVFVDNNQLLVSVNGKSSYSKWEYIKQNSSLLIDDGKNKYLLKIVVCGKDIIVLNIDSTDNYSFLINSKSSSLKNASYEDLQLYLFDNCGLDFLTETQRKKALEKKRIKSAKKIQEYDDRIKDFWTGLKILFIVLAGYLIIYSCIESYNNHVKYKNSHPDLSVTKEENKVAIDLGLSVKWATCNVGANSPLESGNYYGWGEPTGNDVYSKTEPEEQLANRFPNREYNTSPPYSIVNSSKDMAKYNWGKKWRMPSKQEVKELLESCKFTLINSEGKRYVKVTGPNGNFIEIPSAGFWNGSNGKWLRNDGYSIFIYIGELYDNSHLFSISKFSEAAYLFIGDDPEKGKQIKIKSISRYQLLPVRAVTDNK